MKRLAIPALAAVMLAAPAPTATLAQDCVMPPADDPALALARTDHAVTGNRVAAGCGPLEGSYLDVALGGTPAWVLPDPSDRAAPGS